MAIIIITILTPFSLTNSIEEPNVKAKGEQEEDT